MDEESAPPGKDGTAFAAPPIGFSSSVTLDDDPRGLDSWSQEYLATPSPQRLGVCCSGGGIRSAAYCLGALQVLQRARVLDETEYLAAVSGGGYTAIGRAIVQSATAGDFDGVVDAAALASFKALPPFAQNSPEERNLRDRSQYLARGSAGKLWLGVNVAFGAIRHLLPFVAWMFAISSVLGVTLRRWLGPTLHRDAPLEWRLVFWNLWLFALVQKNVLDTERWQTREELRLAIVIWIERTYHRRRRQRGLGKLTPIEFETVHEVAHAA